MADQAKYTVTLEFETSGADAEIRNLRELQRGIDEAARAGGIGSKAQERLSKATESVSKATKEASASLPTLRYALYDVSSTLAFTGAAFTAFSVGAFAAAISYERSFADVIRTNDQLRQSASLSQKVYQEFLELAGEIPTNFGDLSQIGTLAGQLGVPTQQITDFTEAVAMFSATTGETIDVTATAFGRLDALLPDVQGNYQALGSSILQVGVNSVATEGQVISITTQLAGIGSQAGLTADELIGLSGALASVGIQPELARGTITRLFGQISRAVTVGGQNLENFARISGNSADEFTSKWNSAPMEAVLDILRGVQVRGGEAEAALRSVGITSTRDVPAILRLSQTVDSVLVPALQDAEEGFRNGTELADNYGVIAETTASRLQILINNIQSLFAAAGESATVFKGVVDVLNNFVVGLRALIDIPVVGQVIQLGVVLTAVSGVLLIIAGGVTRAAAGMLAFRTAMQQAGVTSTGLTGSLVGLTAAITGANASSVAASRGMGVLTLGVKGLGVASLALTAISVATWLKNWIAEINNAVIDTDTLTQALSMLNSGISDVVSQDIQAVIDESITGLGASTQTKVAASFIPIVGAYVDIVRRAGYAAEEEFDLGLERLGMRATNFWTTDVFTGDPTWLAGVFDSSYEELDKFEAAWVEAWATAGSETQRQSLIDGLDDLEAQVVAAGGSSEDFRYNLQDVYDVMSSGVDTVKLNEEAFAAQALEVEALSDAMNQLVDDVFSSVNAQYELFNVLSDVGDAFINEGAAVAFTGSAMQDAIKAIIDQSGGAGTAAANLQVLFDYLVQGGYASAAQLIQLQEVIAGLQATAGNGRFAPTLSLPDFRGFTAGVDKARGSLNQAATSTARVREEVRTLLDYANDLAKIWGRAFDIRFSGQNTLDAITSSFISIREAADEAARRIRDLNNDIASLSSDISIQEYFLSIAVEYGDTQRAAAIEAELAKQRAELADRSEELRKEQDKANKSLEGNSQSAIDNRKTITDLVRQYQAHIGALAESGLSQEDLAIATQRLRADFIAQATQLGYNRQELDRYAAGFDDVAVAINRVPRNITVAADVNPAVQAFNEFQAAADRASGAVSGLRGNASAPIGLNVNEGQIKRAGLTMEGAALRALLLNTAAAGANFGALGAFAAERNRLKILESQGFASGGYTGPGGRNEPAGVVHRGEYVLPANMVNQSTGLPYVNALGQLMSGIAGGASRASSSAGGSLSNGTIITGFSAGAVQQLASATGKVIMLNGQVIADSSASVYDQQNTVGAN